MINSIDFPRIISILSRLCILLLAALPVSSCTEKPTDYFQGYVEGEYVLVSSPLAGRLELLAVRRGQDVAQGQQLFVLEHDREQAAVSEAGQGVTRAENILADLEKGKRPTEISALEARLKQAQTTHNLARDEFKRRQSLFRQDLIPQEEFDRVRTEMERSASAVAQFEAELKTAKLGARSDLLDAARSDVKKAVYNLEQARWQLEQKSQAAPAAGFVYDTFYREGEFVPAAYPVLSLLPPDHVKIRFFVPETILGQLAIGDKITVYLDGRNNAVAAGISYISPSAEYTPPVIYSRETRAKLVFMIEAVPDPAAAAGLHPGQPVDVILEPPNG
jgi:HlyD family secretion protein